MVDCCQCPRCMFQSIHLEAKAGQTSNHTVRLRHSGGGQCAVSFRATEWAEVFHVPATFTFQPGQQVAVQVQFQPLDDKVDHYERYVQAMCLPPC